MYASRWGSLLLLLAACGDGAASDPSGESCEGGGSAGETPRVEPEDELTPLRLLRRSSIALLGVPPSLATMEELQAEPDTEAQLAYVDAFIDDALNDPRFYGVIFEHARKWLNIPLVDRTADAPEYGPKQQRVLVACEEGTAHEGALHYFRGEFQSAEEACDAAAPTTEVEPWWAPGTTVTLTGEAANTSNEGEYSNSGTPTAVQCNGRAQGNCGCYTHAASCWVDPGTYPGWAPFVPENPAGQRRQLSEEPARLFAHLLWHDRPATDFILADISVGPTELQAAYVQQSLAGGELEAVDDASWWDPASFADAPVDPLHDAGDPEAWREFVPSERNRFFLAARDTKFDPRNEAGPAPGMPTAGMLTSLGFLDAYPRERLRAARALEAVACEQLLPPGGDIEFNAYVSDPGYEGPCQHCHARIDTAALHFKRWGKNGSAFEGWGAEYFMPGIGAWQWDAVWRTGAYPYGSEPFAQWNKWYAEGTRMTPATTAEVEDNLYALFLDFLPPGETMLGQESDGTIGPLGFAKLVVNAGAFDKCVVRRLHERVLGRDIDPALEAGYLNALTKQFVDGGRVMRPFVKLLTQTTSFRRGV